ncbi:histidine kinase dimerization/phosphoacceptor domain-containing protein [Spiractinospora alimapuensis]|uniref:histidine kinase n=1 Tax=Spiractinospora alimapuensis TaxID=2820884 RepID=UPI001F1C6702|nr:histidine kinase [Spiractinospora alimapuensis]QVQ54446.1 histidine kinase dimerization/phosphoacceptor domain-containing protein [Spiractinospora alimapuensis]
MGSTAFPLPRGWPEVVFAVGVAVASVVIELVTAFATDVPLEARNLVVLLVGAAALLTIRRLPILAAVVLALVAPAYYVLGDVDSGAGWLAFAIGVVWLAMERERVAAVTSALLSMILFATAEFSGQVPLRAVGVFVGIASVLALGEIARSRRAYLLEVKQRLAHAERTREEEARRRSTEERMRIARELHDVLAHQISLINVQAGAAVHRRDPERAYAALEEIRLASKGTLRELRTILGVLRQVDEDDAELLPTPGLARLDELAESTRRRGSTSGSSSTVRPGRCPQRSTPPLTVLCRSR